MRTAPCTWVPGEFMPTPDVAVAVRKITRDGSERIVEAAFSLAARRRRKVTVVHKANVLRLSDGFFLDCARRVAARHPGVDCEERLVDAMAAFADPRSRPVRRDRHHQTCSATSCRTKASEIAGSLGIGASLNAGHHFAVAQAQARIGARYWRGRDLANPTSLIESAAMLLAWLEERGRGE